MKSSRQLKLTKSGSVYFSPLALVALSACGGGGGSPTTSGGGAAAAGGAVVKGPLENALVFIDYDQDGVQGVGEPSAVTGSDGSYSITHTDTTDTTFDIVAIAGAGTIDASSGSAVEGFTLSAPSDAGVVTPATTMVVESGGALSAADVADILNLPVGVDPLTFNPYGAGVNAADALAVEKVAQQLMGAINAYSASLEGAGASSADSFSVAMNSVVEVLKDKKVSGDKLDITKSSDLDLIAAEVDTSIGASAPAGLTANAWTSMKADTAAAVKAVADNIAAVSSLDDGKGSFGNTEVLRAQIKAAAELEAATPGAGVGQVAFTNPDSVASSASNLAPTDLAIGSSSISEAAESLIVGTVTTTDLDQPDGIDHKYSIAQVSGEDFAAFSINEATGELAILAQPDFETKSSYKVTIKSTDSGGKSITEKFTITIEDANDPPTIDNITDIPVIENVDVTSGTLEAEDLNGDTVVYLVKGQVDNGGVFTKAGTYGTLTLNKSSGAYSYALDNTNATVDDLLDATAESNTLSESFNIQLDDGNYIVNKTISFKINGVNDIATLVIPSDGSVVEEAEENEVTGTITASDSDSELPVVSLTGVTAADDAFTKVGTYGTLVLNEATPSGGASSNSYTYTLNNEDPDTAALSGADVATESFSITVTDEDGGVGVGTLNIEIQGYGVTVVDVAGDNKINLAEATAGFEITGRGNPGKEITLAFSGSSVTLEGGNSVTVDENGDWSVSVTAADVEGMGQGAETLTASLALDESTTVDSAPISLSVDTAAPEVAITGVELDLVAKTITANGSGFNGVGANGVDVTARVDLTKFAWDIDGDGQDLIPFTAETGTLTVDSDTALIMQLTDDAFAALIAEPGFAADGIGETNLADKLVVADGAFSDAAGNTQDGGGKTAAPSYSDTAKPLLAGFSSTSVDAGASKGFPLGAEINITATMEEPVLGGSTITVTLSTNDEVVLTAEENGTTLVGILAVPVNTTEDALAVQSFEYTSVSDLYGNAWAAGAAGAIPGGENLSDYATIEIDTGPPETVINSVKYKDSVFNQVDDPDDDGDLTIDGPGVIEISGDGFEDIGTDGTDIKAYLDWQKFVWDVDGAGTDGVTFTLGDADADPVVASDIASAVVGSGGTKVTVTLTSEGTAKLEGATGFARDGLTSTNVSDQVAITAGFTQDVAGNPSEGDAATVAPTYYSTAAPTIVMVDSTSDNGAYGLGDDINITLTTSKIVLGGSAVTVTLGTGDEVILTAAENGTTLTGTYTVPAGKTSSGLSINSVEAATGQSVISLYNVAMSNFSIPAGEGLADNTDITIDTAGPETVINSVKYKDSVFNQVDDPDDDGDLTIDGPGVIEISGDGFEDIGTDGTDIKAYLDWQKFVWDVDGAGTDGVTFTLGDADADPVVASDIASAVVGSGGTKVTVTLTSEGTAKLEGATGFARDGLTSTNVSDQVAITAGFTQDVAGNPSEGDAATVAPTYYSTAAPTIVMVDSTSDNGAYGLGDDINITLTTSKIVLGGSAVTVTLGTGDEVILTAAENGTTLTGTYTVPAGKTSSGLSINSVEAATGQSVISLYNVAMSNFSIPAGEGLADNTDITIDTAGPETVINSVKYKDSVFNQVDDPDDDGDLTIDGPGVIEISGDGFEDIGTDGTDIKAYLDWQKFVWDVDGAGTDGVTFTLGDADADPVVASDIASAVVGSGGTKVTVTLTSEGTAKLEGATGFARDGLTSTNVSDQVAITAGFTQDVAGNPSEGDAATVAPTYYSTAAPTIVMVDSTSDNGAYGLGDDINITLTTSKIVLGGSAVTVTLGTGDEVILTAAENGTTLTGTYTVPAGKTSSGLSINSVEAATGQSVISLYNVAMSNFSIPAGEGLADNTDITIDTAGPETVINSVKYKDSVFNQVDDPDDDGDLTIDGPGVIEISGDGFEDIGTDGTDIKAYLDWQKFVWDVDGAGTDGVTFTLGDADADPVVASDIASAVVGSGGTKVTVTLTSEGTAKLEGATGFARDGLTSTNVSDQVAITAGFTQDVAGNPSEGDAATVAPTYYDTEVPTIVSFTSTTQDGRYKVNDVINITATVSKDVLQGSSMTVTLGTGDAIELIANSTGAKLTGTYRPSSGDTSADLTIDDVSATSGKTVTTPFNVNLTEYEVPAGENLSDNSNIIIDTTAPLTIIDSVEYNAGANTITLTGDKFTGAGAVDSDIKAQLDWTKFIWDIDGLASDPGISFEVDEITSAVVTSNTELTITLSDDKAAELEGADGFAADGLGIADTDDQLDISTGFIKDLTGNAATTDAALNTDISYSDTQKPSVISFTSSSDAGSYNSGDTINITATMSETVLAGSKITVTLNTNDKVELTLYENGTTLTGTYTAGASDNVDALDVSSFAIEDISGTATKVTDVYGNLMVSTNVPGSGNISNTTDAAKAIEIDNIPNIGTGADTVTDVDEDTTLSAGDTFVLNFADTVGNFEALASVITSETTLGAADTAATAVWNEAKTELTVTLGDGETFDDGGTIEFTNVEDDAGNITETISFQVDLA